MFLKIAQQFCAIFCAISWKTLKLGELPYFRSRGQLCLHRLNRLCPTSSEPRISPSITIGPTVWCISVTTGCLSIAIFFFISSYSKVWGNLCAEIFLENWVEKVGRVDQMQKLWGVSSKIFDTLGHNKCPKCWRKKFTFEKLHQ